MDSVNSVLKNSSIVPTEIDKNWWTFELSPFPVGTKLLEIAGYGILNDIYNYLKCVHAFLCACVADPELLLFLLLGGGGGGGGGGKVQ